MRTIVLGVLGALAGLGVLGAGPAFAESSFLMGVDVGAMIGQGPLAARFDPMMSITAEGTITRGPWMLDGGMVFLHSQGAEAPAGTMARSRTSAANLDAFGWSVAVRRHVASSAIGASFLGAGYSVMALTSSAPGSPTSTHVGRLQGPKLTAGIEYIISGGPRRAGLALSASYQWLIATFDDGGQSYGGYAGLELTFVQGFGTCRDRTSWNCGRRY